MASVPARPALPHWAHDRLVHRHGRGHQHGVFHARDGTITSIAAYLSTAVALALVGTDLIVQAQLYSSPTPNDSFAPVAGAVVTLPALTGVINIGDIASGITTGLSIPVHRADKAAARLLLTATGLSLVNTLVGYASAGRYDRVTTIQKSARKALFCCFLSCNAIPLLRQCSAAAASSGRGAGRFGRVTTGVRS